MRKVRATTNNITDAIITWLNYRGHFAFRVNNGAVFDPVKKVFRKPKSDAPALSDILCVLKPSGVLLAVEVKNALTGDRPKSKQKTFADTVKSCGGMHHFAKGYDSFKQWYENNVYDDFDEGSGESSDYLKRRAENLRTTGINQIP